MSKSGTPSRHLLYLAFVCGIAPACAPAISTPSQQLTRHPPAASAAPAPPAPHARADVNPTPGSAGPTAPHLPPREAEHAATRKPTCGLPEDIREPDWPRTLGDTAAEERPPFAPGTITLALLPDTQYYAACKYPHLKNQSEFLSSAQKARNIQAAITLGDLTDHNSPEEWSFFKQSLAKVSDGFPLFLTTGNHDLGVRGTANARDSLLSQYFDETWARKSGALREVMEPGTIDNAFYSVNAGAFQLGVLMLEWSPRRKTVEWANQVLAKHRDHRVIVATHAYLYSDSTRYDFAKKGATQKWNPLEYGTAQGVLKKDGNHDGEMLWNALIRRNKNVFMVVNGHVLKNGTGFVESRGDAGNTVHQVLANYQMLDEGGLGYLRLLEILPDGKTLRMKTYSPSLKLYSYAKDQYFSFNVEPPLYLHSLSEF
ncbi:MAG: metallophosphoesterase [Polyangiaceae bacterium]|nr:metallophosphoesterase [Polyangiaceae bacterium]